jgi:hypothetical protein
MLWRGTSQRCGWSTRARPRRCTGDAQVVEITPRIDGSIHTPGLFRRHVRQRSGDELGRLWCLPFARKLDPGNIASDSLSPILKEMERNETGTRFNVFRRFREAVLQRSEARQILIDYWMGHSNPSMGDRYGKQLVEDVEYRQEQAKKVGLGFDLPSSLLGLHGLQSVTNVQNKEAA